MSGRRLISSGYALETQVGYSRAVRVGNLVFLAGTTARGADLAADAYQQTKAIIAIAQAALAEAGAELRHIVRSTIYITDLADADGVGRAHGEAFADIRPGCTMVAVAGLFNQAKVEIEFTAVIG